MVAVKLKVRHVFDFGMARDAVGVDLAQPGAWDAARERADGFVLPHEREEWEALADDERLRCRARSIAAIADELGARSLASYGVGTGVLERAIAGAAPELKLFCTDAALRTTARLEELFTEASVARHDLRHDPPLDVDLHLMHRLDAEFADDEWQRIIARFEQPIVFVPNLLLDLVTAVKEIARRLVSPHATRAGWYRNADALRDLWSATHADRPVSIGDAPAFVLKRR